MQKLTLDWAGDAKPETGVVSNEGDDVTVLVEFDEKPGPSGWPLVSVYVSRESGVPAYRESMELDAWLETAYGESDESARQELLDRVREA